MVDHVSFPYRAPSHLPFLHVVSESGSWEKHGLEVNYNYKISSSDAHLEIPNQDVEFVGGNHVSPYAHRARGDTWVYLGQTLNHTNCRLVVRPDSGIGGVADLRNKVIGSRGMHPGLNDWLYLKQRGLDVDRDDYEMISQVVSRGDSIDPGQGADVDDTPLWHWVRDGKVDAAFVAPPFCVFAERAGLKVIDVDPLPMIWFTTISSSSAFIDKHPDIVERFLKGIIEGVHYFKTHPEESIKIIKEKFGDEGALDDEAARFLYNDINRLLEPKLYPTMQAIANVYEEAIRQDKDAAKVNPIELWDMHHIRQIDDSGFINELYGKTND
ncbi:MAG: ABC transporter substrate-binding protein [Alphaproteobacteria bacterium]|nr:ABC transporter substrate-binding protein [Alphaproteobacteria bacterium]